MVMAQFSPYAAGRKVYGNGSYAPTRGQVDPRGYIARGLRQQNQSQSRSGLAAAALNSLRGKQPQKPGGRPMTPNRGVRGTGPGGRPMANQPGKTKTNPGTPVGSPTSPGAAITTPSYVQINSNGQLDLPYSEGMSWEVLQGQQDMNRQLLELQMQQQQQAQEYTQAKRQGEQDYTNLARQTLSGNAGRGLAFSSAHANDTARNATAYNNAMTDLESRNTQFNQGIGAQRAQIEGSFNDMIRQGALQYAQSLAADAGNLGYGKATAKPQAQPKLPKPPAKKKRKK